MYGLTGGTRRAGTLFGGFVLTRNSASPTLTVTNSGTGDVLRAGDGFSSNGALRVGKNGSNEAVSINFQNSLFPATARFLVADEKSSGAGFTMTDNDMLVTGPAGDVGTFRTIMKQLVAGSGTLIRAGEAHTARGSLATGGAGTWIWELGLHVVTAGDGVGKNLGIRLTSEAQLGFGVATAVRADTGLYIVGGDGAGNGGWTNAIRYEENGTLLYNISQAGLVTSGALRPRSVDTFDIGDQTNRWLRVWSNAFVAENDSAAGPAFTFRNDLTSGLYLVSAGVLGLSASGEESLRIDADHNVIMGRVATAITFTAFATNATGGFPYVPTMAGSPIGVLATSYTGRAAGPVIDSANLRIYFSVAGTWRWSALT